MKKTEDRVAGFRPPYVSERTKRFMNCSKESLAISLAALGETFAPAGEIIEMDRLSRLSKLCDKQKELISVYSEVEKHFKGAARRLRISRKPTSQDQRNFIKLHHLSARIKKLEKQIQKLANPGELEEVCAAC